MELKLNVYNGQQLEKTYTADDFILTTGICEDVLKAVDIEKITSGVLDEKKLGLEIISVVIKSFDKFRPFIQSIFTGLTDEEYSRTAVKDVGRVLFKIVTYTLSELANVGADEPKN